MALRTMIAGASGAVLLIGLIGMGTPAAASVTPTFPNCSSDLTTACQDIGESASPAQPYQNNPDHSDWFGSYLVNGKESWCIDFALAAPPQSESSTATLPLTTKFGAPVPADIASEMSFLLLRFGSTQSPDEAAALAWLLHKWTASPDNGHTTDPGSTFATVAFDSSPASEARLPASTQNEIGTMLTDAQANRGPWTVAVNAPAPLIIGTATNWTVSVVGATGKGVGNVPVSLTATGATLPNGTASQVLSTPADGSPLNIAVTPTGANPTVTATVDTPNPTPTVQAPSAPNTQVVVTTGGTTKVTQSASGSAQTAPGNLTVTKSDANTKAPIAGAMIEVTGSDKASPALKQDGSKLVGTDGKPLVLTTGADGTAQVTGLQTPQAVCVIETTPPPGFDQSFDPKNPPTECGTINPGATLQLALTDVPNKIPIKIPAGGAPPTVTTEALVVNQLNPAALVGFGGLLVIAAGGGVLVARRVSRRRR